MPLMDVFVVGPDHTKRVLCADIDPGSADDLREWLCFVKPIGGDLKVVAQLRNTEYAEFCVHTAGTRNWRVFCEVNMSVLAE